mmetsp:Transcript_14172/g.22078  ORF Transcript_14172/g.22078 Transcript_14172/m.22078 type:complete len:108 (+) Transcript_14172:2545-2868(+)
MGTIDQKEGESYEELTTRIEAHSHANAYLEKLKEQGKAVREKLQQKFNLKFIHEEQKQPKEKAPKPTLKELIEEIFKEEDEPLFAEGELIKLTKLKCKKREVEFEHQ